MLKLPADSVITPVGYVDPVGVGRGWHYVVYEAPSVPDAYVVPSFDSPTGDAATPSGFLKAKKDKVTLCDFGGLQTLPQDPASTWPVVFVAPDGTVLLGSPEQVATAAEASLRTNPAMWAESPLCRLDMTQYSKADDLLPDALAGAYAFMCTFPKDSGRMWAENTLAEAVRATVRDLLPELDREARRDAFQVLVQDGGLWFVASPALIERMAPDDRGLAETARSYAESFGLAYHGVVNGGEKPWRWRPAANDAAPAVAPPAY